MPSENLLCACNGACFLKLCTTTDISDFDSESPEKLIVQYPPEVRGSSRLLATSSTLPIEDKHSGDLSDCVAPGDALAFNNTKVMKARLFGQKASGGKIEAPIEWVLDAHTALAHTRLFKPPKPGAELIFEGDIRVVMLERAEELFCLRFEGAQTVYEFLEQNGHLPLPPYIERAADDEDDSRYQTVHARHQGVVAASTAGLYFTDELSSRLKAKSVEITEVTLYVGASIFQPVRVDKIEEHKTHSEWFDTPTETAAAVEAAKARGNKVWAVGITSTHALESAACEAGRLEANRGDTDIFITPGYRFNAADRLTTNLHLLKSILLTLVSAFSGVEHIRSVYRHAVEQEYHSFSHGDAMISGKVE